MSTVTGIKQFTNHTGTTIEVVWNDPQRESMFVPDGKPAKPHWNCTVPHATSEERFAKHRIMIRRKGAPNLFIWQEAVPDHGDFCRYSEKGYEVPARAVDGDASPGGDRTCIIQKNGIPRFVKL